MSKHLHPGKAAFNGVLVGRSRARRLHRSDEILEGDRGFFRAMSSGYDETRDHRRTRRTWKVSENCYKIWSCCGHTHSAVDVAVALRRERDWKDDGVGRSARGAHRDVRSGVRDREADESRDTVSGQVQHRILRRRGLLYGGASLEAFSEDRFANGALADETSPRCCRERPSRSPTISPPSIRPLADTRDVHLCRWRHDHTRE